jgi:hypothetical protein
MSMSMGAELLCRFLHVEDSTALVLAALGAGAMGQLLLVAVRALGNADGRQKIVRTADSSTAR